jgi:chemotaxis protein methyltransferase CheR
MSTSEASRADAIERGREYAFTKQDFNALRELVKRTTGINLAESKQELVYGRLTRRLRALGLGSFREYRDLLESNADNELVEFTNAITTNLTSFFRESHHFDYLRDKVLKPLSAKPGPRRLRFWSAGCSTGEEPYSIAMTVCEALPDWQRWDIKILATDLDSEVVAKASAGIYGDDRVRGMSQKRINEYFTQEGSAERPKFRVTPALRSLITFRQLNLMHALPMKGPFDVVFCRNVVIYFDKDTQRELFARMARLQQPDQLLMLGHSESMFKISEAWDLMHKTMYRRNHS